MPEDRLIPHQATPDRPTSTILVDGSEISGAYQVASITVTKKVNQVSSCVISIFDGDTATEDFEISNTEDFLPGKEIEIKLGYYDTEETVFKGIITRHSIRIPYASRSILELECKDEAVKMTIGRKNAYFFESTDSDIIEEIIGNYSGLSKDVESTSVSHAEMVQYYCTDWDFVASRAEVNGMLIFNSDGELKVAKPDTGATEVVTLVHGSTIMQFEGEMDARYQYAAVKSKSWDFAEQALVESEGADPGVTEAGNFTAKKLSEVIGLSEFELQHPGKVEDTELQAWADAKMMRSRLAKTRGRVRCQGFAAIKPGDTIRLEGLGDRFNGNVFVSGIRQMAGLNNWTTDIEFGLHEKWFVRTYDDVNDLPAGGLVSGINGLQTGIVTALEGDPEGEFRVQVKMPMVSLDEDGIWARVALLDAGDTRGTFWRPEIDDEVAIGFINGDPRDPLIIGSLHSSAKPSPIEPADDNHEKGIYTREGMRILFDDEKLEITIDTPKGNLMILSEDSGSILIEDENGNKMEMTSSGIDIESAGDINIKATGDVNVEGTNVNIAASAGLVAEGSATAELSSGGSTTVKGGIVQIN